MTIMSHDVAQRLAEFTVSTQLADLSPGAIMAAKQLTLKTVAGMLVGATMPAGRRIANFVKAAPDGEDTGVVGTELRASLWKAVFASAFFAHQSELEDDRLNTGTSWDITTVPMLVPLAEKHDLDGAEFTVACAVGLEVMARTCQFYPQGWLGLSIVPPSVGPAALAARVMKLDAAQTASAFGLAMSGVPLSYTNFGTDAHYFETSLQTLNGMVAAQSAALGLDSNPDLVRYLSGLLGPGKVTAAAILAGLGTEWQFREIWVKKYPCCFYNHRYIDGLLDITRKERIAFEQIERITAHVAPGAQEICNRPAPQTIGDLQFSYQHNLAAAAMDGDVSYAHIAEERIADPRFVQARTKVDVVIRKEWANDMPLHAPARLEIRMKDGRSFASERKYPTGTIEEPLTLDQVKALFHKFVGDRLPQAARRFVADALGDMDRLDRAGVRRLIQALQPAR